jgi:hypothetical protein
VAVGLTEQFTATGTYSDKSTQNLTSQATWASATTSVATISNAAGTRGLATGVAAGTSTISATLGSITGSTVLTVTSRAPGLTPVAVKDNSLGGYYQYGRWTTETGGYLGTMAVANPATSSTASNRWNLTVPAGTYDAWATWVAGASNATNAGYSIYDGFNNLGTVKVNQLVAPADGQYGGIFWADLGTFSVSNGKITVSMSVKGANGDIVADGILLTATPSANAGGQTSPDPAVTITSTSTPTGPVVPATPGQGPVGAVPAETSTVAPAAVSNLTAPVAPANPTSTPAATVAQPSITVHYAADSTTGEEMNPTVATDKGKLTDRALGHLKSKHRRAVHDSLIQRLARMHVTGKKHVVHHHEGS